MAENQTAIEVGPIQEKLTAIEARAKDLAVSDQSTYALVAQFVVDAKAYLADVHAKLDPFVQAAKTAYDTARNLRAGYVDPVEALIGKANENCAEWRAAEKRRAEAETKRRQEELERKQREDAERDRRQAEAEAAETRRQKVSEIREKLRRHQINKREAARLLKEAGAEEEAAKATAAAVAEEQANAPAPEVHVAPAVPKVAGVRNQTFYYAEVFDPTKILHEFATTKDVGRRTFLARFVTVSEQEVGKFARETKDDEKTMAALPGVRAWSKG